MAKVDTESKPNINSHAENHNSGRGKGLGKRLAYLGFGGALGLLVLGSLVGSGGLALWGFVGGILLGSAGLVGQGLSRK